MLDITFLGCGSGLHPELGSTSAFFTGSKGTLVLIDCGYDAFTQLIRRPEYEQAHRIVAVNTRTHADHVAGLPPLINHSWTIHHRPMEIMAGTGPHARILKAILDAEDVNPDAYTIRDTEMSRVAVFDDPLRVLRYRAMSHVTMVPSFAVEFDRPNGITLWSGDVAQPDIAVDILTRVKTENIEGIYVECCEGLGRVALDQWAIAIPEDRRDLVTIMHTDSLNDYERAQSMGFRVALEDLTDDASSMIMERMRRMG